MDFLRALYAEFFKTRKTLAFWGAILLPLILCGIVFAAFYFKHKNFDNLPPMALWLNYATPTLFITGNLILPIFIIFMAYSVNAIEHRSDTWKSMFTMPVSKWTIYSAKYLYAVLLVGLSMFLFCSLTVLSGNLLAVLVPTLEFNEFPFATFAFSVYCKLFLASLGIVSIQFLLSLVWADFLKPMGVGFISFIVGVIAADKWEYGWTIPYEHPLLALKSLPRIRKPTALPEVELLTREVWAGLAVAAAVYVIGYFVVVRKSVK